MLSFHQSHLFLPRCPKPRKPLPPFLADAPDIPRAKLPSDAISSTKDKCSTGSDDDDQSHSETGESPAHCCEC